MSNTRKTKRSKQKKQKKEAQKRMKKQVFLFGKLSNNCLVCDKVFDKKNKKHAMTWKVIVKEKEEIIRLYCPTCWDLAEDLIKEIKNDS